MIKFELNDIESYKLEFGDKFYLPEREKRQNLRTGDIVKLIFRFEDDEFAQVERMWVIVSETNNGEFTGILDNEPFIKGCLNAGDEIKFNYKNVLEIYKDYEN
ncbi:DUF2314 domain-containing protein [uncultured Campylobacter sp.]|uniref:DUF2314 domain-containing protein n=1 Tax=uncultured Campylobacter sp. TaxID=218934 RepID=UPI0015BF8161|nr:DUF2314 domain-containing protein [uncultured Campylobacter sp.]